METEAQQIIASLQQIGDYELKPAAKVLWEPHQLHDITNTASAVSKVRALSEELQSTGNVPQYTQSEASSQTWTSGSTPSVVSNSDTKPRSSIASFSDEDEMPTTLPRQRSPSPVVHQLFVYSPDPAGGTACEVVYRRHPLDHTRWELEKQAHGTIFSSTISMSVSFDRPKSVECHAAARLGTSLMSPEVAQRLGLVIQPSRVMHGRIGGYGPFTIVGVIKDVFIRPFANSGNTFSLNFMVCEGLAWTVLGQTLFLALS